MALTANQSITLSAHLPKKDAVIAVGAPTVGAGAIAIWLGASINTNLSQQVVGDLHKLCRYALATLQSGTALFELEIPLGGSDNDIVTMTDSAVAAGAVGLIIEESLVLKEQSHFIDRTFKRLIERLLEEAK